MADPDNHAPGPGSGPLTYGAYLRVPELLDLQSPLSLPAVHDEMLLSSRSRRRSCGLNN